MDRQQIFPGQVPLETDLLNTNKNVMTAIAKLAAAMFGTSTVVNGLAVTQTTVASMQVSVAAGEIYQLANMDSTAYSSLAADTTHQIMKQGISLDPQLLTLVAPGTVGFSVNYLIEATFSETDTTPVVLPYYNASNPSTAYSGPANAGTTNNTKRQGLVNLVAKAGTAATTGTQTTPAPDSGYVGIAVVTVAYGAVSVVNANISAYSGAPFINSGLLGAVAALFSSPAQFDNSLKVPTTAFVQQAIPNAIQSISASVASNALTVGYAGGATIQFRSPTLSTGAPVSANIASALSLVVPSGATLGTTSAVQAQLALVLLYNGGAPALGIVNMAGGVNLDETTLLSTTAISASATSASVVYSTAAITSSPFRVLGVFTATEASAGAWATTPSTQQGVGGLAGIAQLIGNSAAFASSQVTNGYQKLPSGLIIQWGLVGITSVPAGSSTNNTVTLPITFPTGILWAGACAFTSGSISYTGAETYSWGNSSIGVAAVNTFTAAQSIGASWLAIGR